VSLPESGSATPEEVLTGLFGVGSQQTYIKTWLEFVCKRGHHYARYATIREGKKTRKIAGGGWVGTFDAALARGQQQRVAQYIGNHYPNCHYRDTFDQDLARYRLTAFAPVVVTDSRLTGRAARPRSTDIFTDRDHQTA
jgi:hypothetical protein